MPDVLQSPSARPWPPLLLVGAIAFGIGVDHLVPAPLSGSAPARVFGILLAAAAILLDVAAILTLMRHRTNVLPHRGAQALVTSGPFNWSRNPIYLGNVLLTTGLAFAFANAWLLAAAALQALLLHRLAIGSEERHLEARFGEAWCDYRTRTPRWIGYG